MARSVGKPQRFHGGNLFTPVNAHIDVLFIVLFRYSHKYMYISILSLYQVLQMSANMSG